MIISRLLAIPAEQLCTPEARARIADLVAQGAAIAEATEGWASDVREVVAEHNARIRPLELSDDDHEIASKLIGILDLTAAGERIAEATERLHQATE